MARKCTMQADRLTPGAAIVKGANMTRILTLITLAAAAALAGCDDSDRTIVAEPGGPDPMANAVRNAGSVQLPPPIAASKTYRCKDNSLVYIDWYNDGTARVKASPTDVGTSVTPGEGAPLQGDPAASTVTYNGQSCKG